MLQRVVEFDSVRKMMTVVIRTSDEKVIVFTKGADTSIEQCLIDYDEKDRESMRHLNSFAG